MRHCCTCSFLLMPYFESQAVAWLVIPVIDLDCAVSSSSEE